MLKDHNEAMNVLEGLEAEELSSVFSAEEKQNMLKTIMIGKYQSKLNSDMSKEFTETLAKIEENSEIQEFCP